MRIKGNLLFKTVFIYSCFCSIFSIIISILKAINIELNYDLMKMIMPRFIIMPMIISIPILCFIYIYMVKKQDLLQTLNNLEVVNEKFGIKNLCMINIIHNCIFIFSLGFSISLTILEIIAIIVYLNINKIIASKLYTNFIRKIINNIVYIVFIFLFLFTILVYPSLISMPYLCVMYLYFNKKINNNNNKKVNFIFKLFCGIAIIHSLAFSFNMVYSIFSFILETVLIIVYLLYMFSKINLKINGIIKPIIWFAFIVIYFKSSYLLSCILYDFIIFN